jgi:hypothetical protein
MPTAAEAAPKSGRFGKPARVLGWILVWAWAIIAGGGGFLLLWQKGPLPLSNGWFAMFSGIAICPLTAKILRRLARITVSTRTQILAAAFFFVAGRIALLAGI